MNVNYIYYIMAALVILMLATGFVMTIIIACLEKRIEQLYKKLKELKKIK